MGPALLREWVVCFPPKPLALTLTSPCPAKQLHPILDTSLENPPPEQLTGTRPACGLVLLSSLAGALGPQAPGMSECHGSGTSLASLMHDADSFLPWVCVGESALAGNSLVGPVYPLPCLSLCPGSCASRRSCPSCS